MYYDPYHKAEWQAEREKRAKIVWLQGFCTGVITTGLGVVAWIHLL